MKVSGLSRTFAFVASMGYLVATAFVGKAPVQLASPSAVASFKANRWYWQIEGEPTMLLGADETDHTFLMEDPKAYLQDLQNVGREFCSQYDEPE